MGLERRGNKLYYYKKIRLNGRVKSVYYGSGELAESLSLLDELDKREKRLNHSSQKEVLKNELEEMKALTKDLDNHCKTINSLIETILLINNHHNHKGEWRRQRANNQLRPKSRNS